MIGRTISLIDSSVWILLFRGRLDVENAVNIRRLIETNEAATNHVIRVEVLLGCRTEIEFQDVEDRLRGLLQLPIGETTWEKAARLGFALRRQGITAAVPDLIISASAMEHAAVLLHADADFDRIAAKSDLRVESYA